MVSAKNLVAGLFLLAGSNANNAIRFLEETDAPSQASEMLKPAPMSPARIPSQNPPGSIPQQGPPPAPVPSQNPPGSIPQQGPPPAPVPSQNPPGSIPQQGPPPAPVPSQNPPGSIPQQGPPPAPSMPGGSPSMPGGSPSMPGRSPSMPGGSPSMPGGSPSTPPGTPDDAQMVCPDFLLSINVFVGQLWEVCQEGDVVSCRGQFSTLILIIQPLLSIDVDLDLDLDLGIFLYLALFPGSTASPEDVSALIEVQLGEYESALDWYRYLTNDLLSLDVGVSIGSLTNVDISLGLRNNLGVVLLMLFACP